MSSSGLHCNQNQKLYNSRRFDRSGNGEGVRCSWLYERSSHSRLSMPSKIFTSNSFSELFLSNNQIKDSQQLENRFGGNFSIWLWSRCLRKRKFNLKQYRYRYASTHSFLKCFKSFKSVSGMSDMLLLSKLLRGTRQQKINQERNQSKILLITELSVPYMC